MVTTFESVEEILKCDHSYGSYWAVLSSGDVKYPVKGGYNFVVHGLKDPSSTSHQNFVGSKSCVIMNFASQGGPNFEVYI